LSTPLTVCLMLLGRHVPELAFLEILLGDEPVLSPQQHFYQRLLATDSDEARDLAEAYKKENTLVGLYDSVMIPALSLAETDRHTNALDAETTAFIFQTTKALIEELDDESDALGESEPPSSRTGLVSSKTAVVCVPARDEADELVAIMLSQLLRRAGGHGSYIAIGTISEMLKAVSLQNANIVCVSALPPSAMGHARSVGKQLRKHFPERTIIMGLWNFEGGAAKAQERLGPGCSNIVATSLSQVLTLAQDAGTVPTSTESLSPSKESLQVEGITENLPAST
jgi:hypothetical protein